jgi:hypothetical protein
MLLVDDVLFFPVSSILWIFREINKIAQEELDGEGRMVTEQLRLLYMQLETGRITEAEFDAEEKVLLDRLDAIDRRLKVGEEPGDQEITATEEETYKP